MTVKEARAHAGSKVAGGESTDRAEVIYRTAAEIIRRKGFEATSMSEVARAVDLTKAGLYYYIRGKQDLLAAIMNFAMDMVETQVIQSARAMTDAEERLRSVITCHGRLLTEHGGAITILTDEMASLAPAARRRIVRRKRAYLDFVRDTLEQLENEGKLRDVDVTVAALCLFGTVLGVARWYRPRGRLTSEQIVEEVASIILGGMLKTSQTTTARRSKSPR